MKPFLKQTNVWIYVFLDRCIEESNQSKKCIAREGFAQFYIQFCSKNGFFGFFGFPLVFGLTSFVFKFAHGILSIINGWLIFIEKLFIIGIHHEMV